MNTTLVFLMMTCGAVGDVPSAEEKFYAGGLFVCDVAHPELYYKEGMLKAAAAAAIEMEIMDERENRYIFIKKEEFKTDMRLMANRYRELRDVPSLSELWKIPQTKDGLSSSITFNREFRKTVEVRMRLETDRTEGFMQVLKETDELYRIYDAARDAKCEFYYITVRRQAMKKLVCMLGQENFEYGIYPPCVPTWHFVETP